MSSSKNISVKTKNSSSRNMNSVNGRKRKRFTRRGLKPSKKRKDEMTTSSTKNEASKSKNERKPNTEEESTFIKSPSHTEIKKTATLTKNEASKLKKSKNKRKPNAEEESTYIKPPSHIEIKKTTTPTKNEASKSKKSKNKRKSNAEEEFTFIKPSSHIESKKVDRILPEWISNPALFSADLKNNVEPTHNVCHLLENKMHDLLKKKNIKHFFPVQEAVIPLILETHCGAELRWRPRDMCVAAPTGSGKTLAYVLPLIQIISKMRPIALRALVILPVTELALQVYEVFKAYATQYDLKVGKDSSLLISEEGKENLNCNNVDIFIGTPHRIHDLLINAPDLKLQNLSFLILDEADILMSGEFAGIINQIQNIIFERQRKFHEEAILPFESSSVDINPIANTLKIPEKTGIKHRESKFPSFSQLIEKNQHRFSYFNIQKHSSHLNNDDNENKMTSLCDLLAKVPFPPPIPQYPRRFAHRLLFSATLSHDPHLLQNLNLYHPKLLTTRITGETQISLNANKAIGHAAKPQELLEEYVLIGENLKPILLHHLLSHIKRSTGVLRALVFGNSIEVVHKLAILLRSLSGNDYVLREFTSGSNSSARRLLVKRFIKGKINVLVSTDAMARGIDIPSLQTVISYDVPSSHTYIHRIGRTARAGKTGRAISIATSATLKYLKHAVGQSFTQMKELSIDEEELEQYEEAFNTALQTLASKLKKNTRLNTGKSFKTPKRAKLNVKAKMDSNR